MRLLTSDISNAGSSEYSHDLASRSTIVADRDHIAEVTTPLLRHVREDINQVIRR